MTKLTQIHLPMANAYLLSGLPPGPKGHTALLIDTGSPGDEGRILRAMAAQGVRESDVGAIVLTHAHGDHAGSAKVLREKLQVPVAVHPADAALLRSGTIRTESGRFGLVAVGWEAVLVRPLIPKQFPGLEPDILLDVPSTPTEAGLAALGFAPGTRALHTPGHSAGSITIGLPGGDVIAGDIVRGGLFGGLLNAGVPFRPYYMPIPTDWGTLWASVQSALDAGADTDTWHVGHGGPLRASSVRSWLLSVRA